eukprot:scaffold321299_cov38-Prasinocladus_malaysianus.AAC.1
MQPTDELYTACNARRAVPVSIHSIRCRNTMSATIGPRRSDHRLIWLPSEVDESGASRPSHHT